MKSLISTLSRFFVVGFVCVVVGSVVVSCGGGSSSSSADDDDDSDTTPSTVTVSVTPSNAATGVARADTVSATFSAAITEPLSWYNLIKLQKNGTGDTLCSAISYNTTTRTVSCAHDTLDENSSYTLTVAGVSDSTPTCVSDSATTFTTSGASPVASVEKTSIITTADGTVDITFNFSAALAAGITPSVAVSSETDTNVTAEDCTLSGDRTSCTTTISSVVGCNIPTDYTATLSMTGYEDYEITFNSADNEFEAATTVSANECWETEFLGGVEGDYSWTATGGNLKLAVSDTDTVEHDIYYDYVISSDREGAFAVHVANLDTLATTGEVIDLILVQATNSDFEGLNGVMSGYNGVATTGDYTGWLSVYFEDEYKFGLPDDSGDLSETEDLYEDFYVCQTAYSDVLTTYISTDGENYIKLSEDNMVCADGGTSCDLDQIDSRSISTWSDLRLSLQVGSTGVDGSFYAEFGFARFRTSNLNGTMADCPRMTR